MDKRLSLLKPAQNPPACIDVLHCGSPIPIVLAARSMPKVPPSYVLSKLTLGRVGSRTPLCVKPSGNLESVRSLGLLALPGKLLSEND